MKRIKVNKLRAIAIGFLAVFVMCIIVIPVFSSTGSKEVTSVEVNPPFAPVEYAYPELFEEQKLSDGFSWRINEQNAMEIRDDDGLRYQVAPDGTVYQINPDGSLAEVTDKEVIDDVLAAAGEAASANETAASYLDDDGSLSDEEIAELVGDEVDPDEFRELLEAGLTPEDIASFIEDGYTTGDILEMLDQGAEVDEISDLIEYDQEIRNLLEDTLAGTGITVDELLDSLDDMGVTPEQYLTAFEERMRQADEQSSPTIPAPISSGTDELPPLTINLGGDESAAEEREDEYLAYLDSLSTGVTDPAALASAIASATSTSSDYNAQNDQEGKTEFMDSFSGMSGYDQLTTNDVAPGTVVTMILKTGINSDLPGQIVAEVTQNVYDSLTGRNLLIPKGTRLIATYSSSVSWGQERALVAWTQLIRPDGFIVNLPGLPGIDAQGYAGYHDKVDNHVWDLLWGAGLASLLEVGVNEVNFIADDSGYQAMADILGLYTDDLGSAAQQWLSNVINQQPTLTIRPGRTIKLLVTQKLTLKPYGFR